MQARRVQGLGLTLGCALVCGCLREHTDPLANAGAGQGVARDSAAAAKSSDAPSQPESAITPPPLQPPSAAATAGSPAPEWRSADEIEDDAGSTETGQKALSVSTFDRTTCALMENHTVRCWGDNSTGALGNGTHTDSASPVAVRGLGQAVQLDVGLKRACAVIPDGRLRCWGNNDSGVLRNGNRDEQTLPVTALGVEHVAQVSLGESQTCVRRTDNTLECWVYNSNLAALEVSNVTDVVDVEAGYFVITAFFADGNAHTWSDMTLAGPVADQPIRGISSGYGFVCSLLPDATVRCQGLYSVHDVVDRVDGPVPELTEVAHIASGFEHSCAVIQTGKVYCWGRNNRGQLGDGSTTYTTVPTRAVGLDDVVEVTGGREHSCARTADGSVYCWGSNDSGELGDGTTTERHTPLRVSGL